MLIKLVGIICGTPYRFELFAALVGEFGPQLVSSYARRSQIYYPVALLYFLFPHLYAFWPGAGRVRRFWA